MCNFSQINRVPSPCICLHQVTNKKLAKTYVGCKYKAKCGNVKTINETIMDFVGCGLNLQKPEGSKGLIEFLKNIRDPLYLKIIYLYYFYFGGGAWRPSSIFCANTRVLVSIIRLPQCLALHILSLARILRHHTFLHRHLHLCIWSI
jgi:hypothetical protein